MFLYFSDFYDFSCLYFVRVKVNHLNHNLPF